MNDIKSGILVTVLVKYIYKLYIFVSQLARCDSHVHYYRLSLRGYHISYKV